MELETGQGRARVPVAYGSRSSVSARTNFQKHYDLTERALPELAAARPMTSRAYIDWACGEALDRLGTATTRELADFWGGIPAKEAAAWSDRALRSGDAILAERKAHGDAPAQRCLALPDWQQRVDAIPASPAGVRILAPFDPVIRDRARLAHLFGFDYRFEAFVPQAKRQHGYYVTPLWRGTRPIGRMDPKFDRASGTLIIRGLCFARSPPLPGRGAGGLVGQELEPDSETESPVRSASREGGV